VLSARAVVGNLRDRRRLKAVFDDAHVGLRPSVQGKPVVENRQLTIGDDFTLWADAATTRLEGPGRLVIGDRVFINSGARLIAKNYIEIGDDVAIGFDALIVDSHMHGVAGEPVRHETTIIGAGSWIGARAIVLAGVTIGRRCIVGAGAVVARSVPDDTLVVGNPAIPVKTITYPPGCRKAWNNVWNAAYWDDGGYRPVPGA
jgi:acetyltransferase-like isoleucine patch superfamily enzyme